MDTIIDLGSEVLVDRSQVRNAYLRLLLTAFGQQVVKGSPWVAVDKKLASVDDVLVRLITGQVRATAA